jgi:glyoxylase-like metal-dependent hydrolase (beta-lactamase superfamily II)
MVIVDSAADPAPLVAAIEEWGAEVAAILRTHAHHSHVVPEDELRERYGVEVIAMSAVGIPEPQGLRSRNPGGDHVRRVARNSLRMMRLRT